MTIDQLLHHLDGVRRSGQRWVARCPAHQDKNPSLSIREGERGLLLKCWAGCTIKEICDALRLPINEIFFDIHVAPEEIRKRHTERRERERRRIQDGLRIDVRREAEATIAAAHGIDILGWSNEQLHMALNRLADAYETMSSEGLAHEQ
jgi:hypothetical protein